MDRLVSLNDPSIQSYDVHESQKEPVDLTENRMPIAFKIVGTGDGKTNYIDPRAGRIEINHISIRDKSESGG